MSKRVKLTIAAANVLLKAVKWHAYDTQYQVMRKVIRVTSKGKGCEVYISAYPENRYGWSTLQAMLPRDTYRDALEDIDRMSADQRADAVVVRIRTEVPL